MEQFKKVSMEERFKKVSEIIKPFVKTYFIPCMDDEYDEPIKVNDIMSGIKVVGDSFYGRDWLVEFQTKNGDFGQVRLQKSAGYGTAYREVKPHIIVSVNKNNRWKNFDMETESGIAECLNYLKD